MKLRPRPPAPLAALLALAAASGCGASSGTAEPTLPRAKPEPTARVRFIAWSMPPAEPPRSFPLLCQLRIDSVPGGIALRFSAGVGDLNTLHQQVERFARIYTDAGSVSPGGLALVASPPVVADDRVASHGLRQIREIDPVVWTQRDRGGAWIYLMAREPEQVEALRARVRWHAADLMPTLLIDERCPALPGTEPPPSPTPQEPPETAQVPGDRERG